METENNITGMRFGKWEVISYSHSVIVNCPPNKEVDHKDHNGLNNRKNNLRICSRSQNLGNKLISDRNTSGYKGVSFNKFNGKYSALIGFEGKQYHLGYFNKPEKAHKKYVEKAKELFGEFFCEGKIKIT